MVGGVGVAVGAGGAATEGWSWGPEGGAVEESWPWSCLGGKMDEIGLKTRLGRELRA